jgi:hypothetical protein
VTGIGIALISGLMVWGVVAHLLILITQTVPDSDTTTVFGGQQATTLVESSQTIKPLAGAAEPTVVSIIAPFVFSDIYELFPEQANQ